MEVRLNDAEIREILAEALAKKLDYSIRPSCEECFFEVEAGEIKENGEVDDIHNVKFCYVTL